MNETPSTEPLMGPWYSDTTTRNRREQYRMWWTTFTPFAFLRELAARHPQSRVHARLTRPRALIGSLTLRSASIVYILPREWATFLPFPDLSNKLTHKKQRPSSVKNAHLCHYESPRDAAACISLSHVKSPLSDEYVSASLQSSSSVWGTRDHLEHCSNRCISSSESPDREGGWADTVVWLVVYWA